MKFDDKCIECETTNNLNTFVKLTIDKKIQSVAVCDDHLDLSISDIKEAVLGKVSKLISLLKEMKSLGFDISELVSGKVSTVKKPEPEPEPKSEPEPEPKSEPEPEPKSEPESKPKITKVNMRKTRQIRSITGQGVGGHSSYDIDNLVNREAKASGGKVPVVEEVELQTVTGKGGIPIQIPKKIKESTGDTEIRIIKTDNSLIDKGKKDDRTFSDSYHVEHCSLCNGTGASKWKGHDVCPRCKGAGTI